MTSNTQSTVIGKGPARLKIGRTVELPAVALRLLLGMGKIRGTPCMRNHILVHRATTKIFANSFAFKGKLKRKDFPEIARLPWAQEASGSNPDAPTKNISRVFF